MDYNNRNATLELVTEIDKLYHKKDMLNIISRSCMGKDAQIVKIMALDKHWTPECDLDTDFFEIIQEFINNAQEIIDSKIVHKKIQLQSL